MIRPAVEKDIPTIQNIATKAWYTTYGDILSENQSLYMLEMMYSQDSLIKQMNAKQQFAIIYDLIESKEIAIGFVAYEFNYQSKDIVKIHKLYLMPETKGKGLGKKLIQFVENQAKQHSIDKISLNMNKYNPSFGFYKHIGFEKVMEENINIGNGYVMEDFVLEKLLDD